MKESNVDQYYDVRVVMATSAELCLALPIYADETDAILDNNMIDSMSGSVNKLSFRVSQKIGYILYHPKHGEMIFNNKLMDLVEDLGRLNTKEEKVA